MQTFNELKKNIDRLRDKECGCPWDLKQTHESLLKYLVEESYEYIHAVEEKDILKMKEELGDILLQVLLHSKIAEDNQYFSFNDVSTTLNEKIIRRHPHVFKDPSLASSADDVQKNWSKIKEEEKKDKPFFSKEDLSLPALISAQKIGKKSADVNFDWDNVDQVFDKVHEEFLEVKEEMDKKTRDPKRIFEEIGDLLFSTVQLARHMNFEAEDCLRYSNKKFINRFTKLHDLILKDGKDIKKLNVPELEEYWSRVKAN